MGEDQKSTPDLAPMKAQVYKDPRPKEYFDRFHERARTRDPDWVYTAVRLLTLHNLTYMERLAAGVREAIAGARFRDYASSVVGGSPPWSWRDT